MKTFSEITDNAEAGYIPSVEKSELIRRLREHGHKPISISRAIAIIEQCTDDDESPDGLCNDPLKITIFPDPTLDETPTEIFLYAGRYGFMGIASRMSNNTVVQVPLDYDSYQQLKGIDGAQVAPTLLQLMEMHLQGGYRKRVIHPQMGEMYPFEHDTKLEKYASEAKAALTKYIDRLIELAPDQNLDKNNQVT